MKTYVKVLFSFICLNQALFAEQSNPTVVGELLGQAGNNYFQIATSCALAWDNNSEATFPQLASLPTLYQHCFSRCKVSPLEGDIVTEWSEPSYLYHPISYTPFMKTKGYFQAWKYFDHYRDRLAALFAPIPKDLKHINKKYGSLLNDANTVGIQIRYYVEDPYTFPQYGKDYLEKAMSLFPEDSTFIVSSNRISFAKQEVPSEGRKVIFLENEAYYIDFFILSMCKHNIITNSTFGWWSAYLNQNPDKKVVSPKFWHAYDQGDLCPPDWILISAERIDPALIR